MDFKIRLTETALTDFEEVVGWSWENHEDTSERFARSLLNHLRLLEGLPFLGVPVRGYPGIRKLLHSPLHIYYRVDEERSAIEILHFWHVKRKAPRL
ncbi:MAG: type II toxin-antitoxin system RelE/ParE family toxin [Acidobacteriota bacterium]|nr:type II toxin-antitoxin system RelE/ParE family toxin [Acidobacteriota bacterium]